MVETLLHLGEHLICCEFEVTSLVSINSVTWSYVYMSRHYWIEINYPEQQKPTKQLKNIVRQSIRTSYSESYEKDDYERSAKALGGFIGSVVLCFIVAMIKHARKYPSETRQDEETGQAD